MDQVFIPIFQTLNPNPMIEVKEAFWHNQMVDYPFLNDFFQKQIKYLEERAKYAGKKLIIISTNLQPGSSEIWIGKETINKQGIWIFITYSLQSQLMP